jgi:hypothetical protein
MRVGSGGGTAVQYCATPPHPSPQRRGSPFAALANLNFALIQGSWDKPAFPSDGFNSRSWNLHGLLAELVRTLGII